LRFITNSSSSIQFWVSRSRRNQTPTVATATPTNNNNTSTLYTMTPHQTSSASSATLHQAQPTYSATPTNPPRAMRHSASGCPVLRWHILSTLAALLLCLAPLHAQAQQTTQSGKPEMSDPNDATTVASVALATAAAVVTVATVAAPATPAAPSWTDADTADLLANTYDDQSVAIYGYKGAKKDIVIPDKINGKTVVQITENAFKDKGLTSVVLPETLLFIGSSAFEKNQIKTLIIPSQVRSIGKYAFVSNKITNLIIPGSVTEIRDSAFQSNELTNLTLEVGKPDPISGWNTRIISASAFESNKLTSLTISSVSQFTTRFNTGLGARTFHDNPITRVVLAYDAGVEETSIDDGEFYKLYYAQAKKTEQAGTYIKKNGVWTHERESFVEGDFVIDMYRENGLGGVVVGYKGTKKDIIIPDKTNGWEVGAIAEGVFRKKGLTSVVLPKNLREIGKEAFAFNNLTMLTIPKEVKLIGENAFASNALTTLTFPQNGVSGTAISEGAFSSNKLTTAVITLRHGKVAKRAFEGNPLTTIYLIDWELRVEDDAFEKSLLDYRTESTNRWGIFEKKNGTWTWAGEDKEGKYWKRED
jgi:hypothetical protein